MDCFAKALATLRGFLVLFFKKEHFPFLLWCLALGLAQMLLGT